MRPSAPGFLGKLLNQPLKSKVNVGLGRKACYQHVKHCWIQNVLFKNKVIIAVTEVPKVSIAGLEGHTPWPARGWGGGERGREMQL